MKSEEEKKQQRREHLTMLRRTNDDFRWRNNVVSRLDALKHVAIHHWKTGEYRGGIRSISNKTCLEHFGMTLCFAVQYYQSKFTPECTPYNPKDWQHDHMKELREAKTLADRVKIELLSNVQFMTKAQHFEKSQRTRRENGYGNHTGKTAQRSGKAKHSGNVLPKAARKRAA